MAAFSDAVSVHAKPSVVACELDGGSALLNFETSTYFTLNEVGSFIWSAVQQPITIDELVSRITGAYDVPAETCRADLDRLLGRMAEAGIVAIGDGPAS